MNFPSFGSPFLSPPFCPSFSCPGCPSLTGGNYTINQIKNQKEKKETDTDINHGLTRIDTEKIKKEKAKIAEENKEPLTK